MTLLTRSRITLCASNAFCSSSLGCCHSLSSRSTAVTFGSYLRQVKGKSHHQPRVLTWRRRSEARYTRAHRTTDTNSIKQKTSTNLQQTPFCRCWWIIQMASTIMEDKAQGSHSTLLIITIIINVSDVGRRDFIDEIRDSREFSSGHTLSLPGDDGGRLRHRHHGCLGGS